MLQAVEIFLKKVLKSLFKNYLLPIFTTVFHRILDFKAGLDFYLGPFFLSFTF
jgi:hypothetical protein